MNRGLVVNSEPLARVWSPLLAIVLLVLLFPTRVLESPIVSSEEEDSEESSEGSKGSRGAAAGKKEQAQKQPAFCAGAIAGAKHAWQLRLLCFAFHAPALSR